MRTGTMQFAWLTIEEARVFLIQAPPAAQNYGDRVGAARRCREYTERELASIEASRRWNAAQREAKASAPAVLEHSAGRAGARGEAPGRAVSPSLEVEAHAA